jgi:DNA-binding CsgD family transcriptional regulator
MKSNPGAKVTPDIVRKKLHRQSLMIEFFKDENKKLRNNLLFSTLQNARCSDLMSLLINRLEIVDRAIQERKIDCREPIERCLSELKQYLNKGIWNEFKVRFAEIHTDFYDKLLLKHPNLTENDLRLCAFLKLKMSTKDIAAVTYHSVNSVKIARKRLRKKLQIFDSSLSLIKALTDY